MKPESAPIQGRSNQKTVTEDRLAAMTVDVSATIREALVAIDAGGVGLCAVVTANRFTGVLSDGDIRRALIGGASLADSIEKHVVRRPLVARPAELRDQVMDSMAARKLSAVPIVDFDDRLVGLHALHELIRPDTIENLAVVMAGGKGTRLGSLTATVPKPMLEVAGKPILERIVQKLVGQGIVNIAISVNHLAEVIIEHFGAGEEHGCHISYLQESSAQPLGTGGSLSLLESAGLTPTSPIVVMNGDVLTDVPIPELINHHERSNNSITVCCAPYTHTVPFGVVTSEGGRITDIEEKPTMQWSVNAGIYVLSPSVLSYVPSAVDYPITNLVNQVREETGGVGSYDLRGSWLDIGRPAELRFARGES